MSEPQLDSLYISYKQLEVCTTKKGLSSHWLIPSVRTSQCVCASIVLFMSCP